MLFKDRRDAGIQVAEMLTKYDRAKDTLVLGLPRGGVVVAYEVAKTLHLPLDIICPRKIGAPFNPEFAIGAITESGRGILHMDIIQSLEIPESYIQEAIQEETERAKYRVETYRKNLRPRIFKGMTIILVDDGLATGATMEAAIESLKGEGVKSTVVAVPVAPRDTVQRIEKLVDECHVVATPPLFSAIGEFYLNFGQTTDEEVIQLLKDSFKDSFKASHSKT